MSQSSEIQREQYRQAKSIHGGFWGYWVAKASIQLSRLWLPTAKLRLLLYRYFNYKYPPGIKEVEAELPLEEYPSLNALFTRGIKPEYRPIAQSPWLISPCDGIIQDLGTIEEKIVTLKNIQYSLSSLLPNIDENFEGWNYLIIFLTPLDCHRVFSPQDGAIAEICHVPGSRLLVHPPFQKPEFPVYTLNERMIFEFDSDRDRCILVMVAGWGVGNITLPQLSEFKFQGNSTSSQTLNPPMSVKRGEWFATFELGSTVILLVPPHDRRKFVVSPNEKVQYGQAIFS